MNAQIRAAYFSLQAATTIVWWLLITTSSDWRSRFAFGDDGELLWSFLPSDLVFWCLGSLAVAYGEWRGETWTPALRWVVCGALGCTVLHSAGLATLTGAGWIGVWLMLAAFIVTFWLAWSATCSSR
jgi:hypothetical protein